MLPELLLIAALGIYDPMDMSGHEMYPSGVKEADKYPRYAYPASKLASLTITRDIKDKLGRKIKSGHYLAGLSISKNEILIFEGNKQIFSINVTSSELKEKEPKFSTAKFYTSDTKESFISLRQGKYKVYGIVELDEQ